MRYLILALLLMSNHAQAGWFYINHKKEYIALKDATENGKEEIPTFDNVGCIISKELISRAEDKKIIAERFLLCHEVDAKNSFSIEVSCYPGNKEIKFQALKILGGEKIKLLILGCFEGFDEKTIKETLTGALK